MVKNYEQKVREKIWAWIGIEPVNAIVHFQHIDDCAKSVVGRMAVESDIYLLNI